MAMICKKCGESLQRAMLLAIMIEKNIRVEKPMSDQRPPIEPPKDFGKGAPDVADPSELFNFLALRKRVADLEREKAEAVEEIRAELATIKPSLEYGTYGFAKATGTRHGLRFALRALGEKE